MNDHERRAWWQLVELGASEITLGGKPALDLRDATASPIAVFIDAVISVCGRSGAVRRHQDRNGRMVFVTTDDEVLGE